MDTKTLLIVALAMSLAVNNLGMGLVFWTRRTYPGFGFWLMGGFSRTVALLLVILPRDQFPPWLTIVLPNYLFFVEIMLYLRGTQVFRGHTIRYGWAIPASLSFLGLFLYFSYITPSISARFFLHSIYCCALEFWLARLLLTRRPAYFGSSDRLQAGVWVTLVAAELARAGFSLASPIALNNLTTLTLSQNILITIMIMSSLLITLSQIIMNAQRLEHDLRIAQQRLEQDIIAQKRYEQELHEARDATDAINRALCAANTELKQLTITDTLTGARNRRHFEETAAAEMQRVQRYGTSLALLLFDIDHFKSINDRCGHLAGDQVLVEITRRVQLNLRVVDVLARWGGEEFAVLLPQCGTDAAMILAEKLRATVAGESFPGVGAVTASFGVAEFSPVETLDAWFQRADEALYRAKKGGRNRVVVDEATVPDKDAVGLHLIWRAGYACGEPVIDAEHRELFRLANALLDLAIAEPPPEVLLAPLDALLSHVTEHFAHEEDILRRRGYADLARHAGRHQRLVERTLDLRGQVEAGGVEFGTLVEFLTRDVVARHMLQEDRAFFP